ncbi:hypothetical protein [Bradyrhizobium sp.]|uniref:hypothetical protein n=1 Tax=Bradyrhizobium sp. TaxID=376 RepID=UPI0025C51B28|nr:hypothetical protein [Bradyrhizobium sp.]
MNEAVLILPNMRGGCATVGNTVHTLFRVTARRPRPMARPEQQRVVVEAGRGDGLASPSA